MIRSIVEVYRKGACPESRELSSEVKELGIQKEHRISFSRIYIIEFDENTLPVPAEERLNRISREILIDPVVEEYYPGLRDTEGISIEVYLKKGVLDIPGRRAVEAAGYASLDRGLKKISGGERYIITAEGGADEETCSYITRKLLFNKVIQEAKYSGSGVEIK